MLLLSPEWCDRLDSTNTVLARLIREGRARPGMILAAREQTAGRGRYDRRWQTREGRDLTFSVYLQTALGFPAVASTPMAAGLAVAEYLRREHHLQALVKWPNDVMVADKKICGILSERAERPSVESVAERNDGADGRVLVSHTVVGIGVNLKMTAADAAAVDKPATSVLVETGREAEPEQELLKLRDYLQRWLTCWDENGFSGLRETWNEWAWRIGQEVAVGDGAHRQCGILEGFGESGELLLRLADGKLQPCWSGDFEY